VKNVDHGMSLREKIRRATTRTLWPDSAIVRVMVNSFVGGDNALAPTENRSSR
jgi:hypothetical protein